MDASVKVGSARLGEVNRELYDAYVASGNILDRTVQPGTSEVILQDCHRERIGGAMRRIRQQIEFA